MATLPSDALPTSLMNIVVDARNSDGAHAYYSNGWEIMHTKESSRAISPGYLKDTCSYTLVFKHDGNATTTKHELIFGAYNAEDQFRVAIQSQKFYTALVTEHNQAQKKHADISKSNIALKGFHVLEYKNQGGALQVYLDGTACLHPNTVKDNVINYRVFKCYPKQGSPFSIWEGHYNFDNYHSIVHKYEFGHYDLDLGVGSYYQFHADWNDRPKIWVGGKWSADLRVPGEQVITIRVYKNNCFITSSADQPTDDAVLAYNCSPPAHSYIDFTPTLNNFYSVTVVFADINSQ